VKTWDVLIIGGGIIGLSLARELRKQGASILVVERGEPGREASYAAGGMLACGDETPAVLQTLATASARMYPEFVHELQDESGENVDLRSDGTLLFPDPDHESKPIPGSHPFPAPLAELEPALSIAGQIPVFLKERSVCPRALTRAALKAAKHRGVDISSGTYVLSVDYAEGKVIGVTTDKTSYRAGKIVNCAGAWAGQIAPHPLPTRPVKGQMVCFAMPQRELLRHVVRSPEIYLIPRSDGRLLAGATVEEAGFDKRTVPETIQRLRHAAMFIAQRPLHLRAAEPVHPKHQPVRHSPEDSQALLVSAVTIGVQQAGHDLVQRVVGGPDTFAGVHAIEKLFREG
jgi:glycine oxidase